MHRSLLDRRRNIPPPFTSFFRLFMETLFCVEVREEGRGGEGREGPLNGEGGAALQLLIK